MVAFLEKPTECKGFEQIVDFLSAHTLRVDGKEIIITESSVRRDIRLANEDGVDYFPNSTIFENLKLMRKPKRKNTQVPQPSGSIEHVVDEAVHKERVDRLVRAATTTSSLEAEQDSGNIDKTLSKATPNEATSIGTTSGGGPRFQEAIGDTIAQTRSLTLEKTKTTQALETNSLKRRVKKLEKKQRSRNHKLKRLYKVCLTGRVDSSEDEPSLGEDASKQEMKINDIDADEDITLVNAQDDAEMFDANDLHGEELFVKNEVTDKQTASKRQEDLIDKEKATLFIQLLEKRRKFFAAKKAKEKRNKPQTQVQQRKIMCTYLKNIEGKKLKDLKNMSFDSIQKTFDKAFKRVNKFKPISSELVEGSSEREGEEIDQERLKKQKVDDDKETTKLKELMKIIPDEEEVAIDAIPLTVKSPEIVDWKIHKEEKKSYY
nr:hypothetical protein [Tanacetum cinerariifolium]